MNATSSRRGISFLLLVSRRQRRQSGTKTVGHEVARSITGIFSSSFSCSTSSSSSSFVLQSQSKAKAKAKVHAQGPCSPRYCSLSTASRQNPEAMTAAPLLVRRAPKESSSTKEHSMTDYYYDAIAATTTTTLVVASDLGYSSSTNAVEVDNEVEQEEEDYDAWTLHRSPPTVTRSDEGRQVWSTSTVEHADILESLAMDNIIETMVTASAPYGGRDNPPENTISAVGNYWDDAGNDNVFDGTTTTAESELAWNTSSSSSGSAVLDNSLSSSEREEDYCDEEY